MAQCGAYYRSHATPTLQRRSSRIVASPRPGAVVKVQHCGQCRLKKRRTSSSTLCSRGSNTMGDGALVRDFATESSQPRRPSRRSPAPQAAEAQSKNSAEAQSKNSIMLPPGTLPLPSDAAQCGVSCRRCMRPIHAAESRASSAQDSQAPPNAESSVFVLLWQSTTAQWLWIGSGAVMGPTRTLQPWMHAQASQRAASVCRS